MKAVFLSMALALGSGSAALGDGVERVRASGSVPAVMDALEAAVNGAGATVFARVDHAGGAAGVGMELAPSQVLIFGNPKLGTPAMQADPLAGLVLPLKVLVYEDGDGQVWLAWREVEEIFDDFDIADGADFIDVMEGALKELTAAAAGG